MTLTNRVFRLLKAVLTLACMAVMLVDPDDGYMLVVFIMDVSLLIYGIRLLIYYFTMARYAVGGIVTLYKSIIVIDFGLFIFHMESLPQKYVMLYLIFGFVSSGAVDIIEAYGAKKLEASSWKYQFFYGFVKVAVGVACLFALDSLRIVTLVYCAGLVHSAFSDIVSACRKTAIVYIE